MEKVKCNHDSEYFIRGRCPICPQEKLQDEVGELKIRISAALETIYRWAGHDESRTKAYMLDQVVRALLGCKNVTNTYSVNGVPYGVIEFDTSPAYECWVKDFECKEDGPANSYDWVWPQK